MSYVSDLALDLVLSLFKYHVLAIAYRIFEVA